MVIDDSPSWTEQLGNGLLSLTMDSHRIGARNSPKQAKNEIIQQKIYSVSLRHYLSWDLSVLLWDREIELKTMSLTTKSWDLRGLWLIPLESNLHCRRTCHKIPGIVCLVVLSVCDAGCWNLARKRNLLSKQILGSSEENILDRRPRLHIDIQAARVTRRKQNQNMCCKSIYFQYYLQKKCSHDAMAPWQWAPYSPQFSIYLHTLCVCVSITWPHITSQFACAVGCPETIGTKVLCNPGGVLDISFGGEVRPFPSYPDPV